LVILLLGPLGGSRLVYEPERIGEVGARRGRDQHPKIVGRLQTRLLTRHASDLAKLLSEVKYALTRKQAFGAFGGPHAEVAA
jgi:hypothetical protein